jgi:hypothetical protein
MPVFNQLRGDHNYPWQETTHRWSVREQGEGHYYRPYVMNGNRRSPVLVGDMRLTLVMYRILFPKATAAELNCYLFNATSPGQEQRLYSVSQICCKDKAGLTRKRGSTTARQANLPHNIDKQDHFINEPYPYGIHDTPRTTVIDYDQAAIFIETTDRGYGKCVIGNDLNKEGTNMPIYSTTWAHTSITWSGIVMPRWDIK